MRCQNCGKVLPDDSVFCDGCGAKVGSPGSAEDNSQAKHWVAPATTPEPKKSFPKSAKVTIAVIAAVALLCIGGVGGYLFAKSTLPEFMGVTFVNAASFPDATLRAAVSDQLDGNHDGVLSDEEARSAATLKATPLGIEFNVDAGTALSGIDPTPGNAPEWAGMENVSIDFTGIERLSELQKIKCGGTTADFLDFSGNPNLEYVDLRGSSIASIDLSNNKNITALLCDPSVQVTGLSESGLYFTDLVTTVKRTMPGDIAVAYEVQYDPMLRPGLVAIDSAGSYETIVYEYDEFGRLVSKGLDGEDPAYTFQYDEGGRISSVTDHALTSLSHGDVRFTYDDQGRLAAREQSTQHSHGTTEYSYEGERLSSMLLTSYYATVLDNTVTQETTFLYDEGGRFTGFGTLYGSYRGSVQRETVSFAPSYDDSGRLVGEAHEQKLDEDVIGSSWSSLTFDEAGNPAAMDYQIGDGVDRTVQFSCNSDGYVERMEISSTVDDGIGGSMVEIGYVKRIGSLEDRAKDAYVPRVSVEFGLANWNGPMSDDLWFQGGAAPQFGAVFCMRDALYAPFDAIDPVAPFAAPQNELALRAYDREALGGRAPAVLDVESENVQQQETPSEAEEEAAQSYEEGQETPEQTPAVSLDLADPTVYQSVNQYLSNFTESSFAMSDPYDSTAQQDGDVIGRWVTEFCRINMPDVVETSPDNDYGIPGPGGGGAQGVYNMRVPMSEVNDVLERNLGTDVDESLFNNAYYAYDGWLYFGVTAPALANGIALTTSATDVGNGRVRVEYDVYRSSSPYDPLDASLYAMSAEELLDTLDAGKLFVSGEAVVEPKAGGGFKLISMTTHE